MGIFGSFKSSVSKKLGTVKQKLFGAKRPSLYGDEEAAGIMESQSNRREKLLNKRVAKGKSSEVYPNRKNNDATTWYFNGKAVGDSPPLERFLDGFPYGRFASSNVYAVVYDRRGDELYIQYLGGKGRKRSGPGRWYAYRNVSRSEALEIYGAISKGIWIWDALRVRGTQTGAKKPYTKNKPPPSDLPIGLED